ncbi:MAG: FAD-dependent oxidoreductase [Spirochaetia bacterium]
MSMKIVVIGGSAAGPKAASKIRRLDQEAEVTIIQKGSYLSMASCGYPYFVGGVFDDRNKLISTPTGVTRDSSFFTNVKGIKALVDTEVTTIDRDKKMVSTKNLKSSEESKIPYDKLVITTGAHPFVPDLQGKDLEGIATLQSMEDADYSRTYCG